MAESYNAKPSLEQRIKVEQFIVSYQRLNENDSSVRIDMPTETPAETPAPGMVSAATPLKANLRRNAPPEPMPRRVAAPATGEPPIGIRNRCPKFIAHLIEACGLFGYTLVVAMLVLIITTYIHM